MSSLRSTVTTACLVNDAMTSDARKKNRFRLPPADWMCRRVDWTYRDLMRGPLVLAMDDPAVVQIIQGLFRGPTPELYRLKRPEIKDNSESGQLTYLLDIIGGKVRQIKWYT